MRLSPKKIKNLVAKALKDKPKWKPSKGKVYLKNLEPGDMFEITGGTKGILIECNVNAHVIIIDAYLSDKDRTLLGKKIIASETEVKKI
jgi:hypothetical protein